MAKSLEFDRKPLEIKEEYGATSVENVYADEEITIEEMKLEIVSN